MPAYKTYPTLLDEVKQISITKLKELGCFEPGSYKSDWLIWSSRGQVKGSINISVDLRRSPSAYLKYTVNKEENVSYRVKLVSLDSNLGVGKIWYFICPHTGKRCRKLYGAGKYFLHRDAYPDAMYECQIYSKRKRELDKILEMVFGIEQLYEKLDAKYYKSHYAGKATKNHKEIIKQLKKSKQMRENLGAYYMPPCPLLTELF